ncbi:1,4-dihydroxy-2-naphthoate polyprenyltransferase [Terracoccus luteus]|uniref:1,4-dihydroxy-2-naphthoate octaprenyltransferase n=1 Tax=Terracoccus luteus TaxID=53356 RepID=A0A839PZC9_9MICO|nr:1,4-dihydroxy-2-naphthoate polyprenyltransferase [Terracoccus luteus]MBB2986152.1 1,4-dihydroxy-2-naphthoate octaprenyltransferase [Terracoccus luteus]MCP2172258.1 1,4-dihydroxy-2-naphthoate octaprenyltransferase [Terracoccus luteus]
MATLNEWIEGARPRTLPAAVSPVLIGTGAAYQAGDLVVAYAVLALAVSLLLQVGVNYANDYSDGIRGTDEVRVGPVRLVGQRLAAPRSVKIAAFTCFFFAGLLGLALVALAGVWLMIPIGAVCIAAAWFYTGGSRPYGYLGLGEVFVFVFFGLVATLGTMATMTPLTALGWYGAVGVGALSSAILVANNLRDIPTDREHGKRTLAVRLGERGTRALYVGLLALAVAMVVLSALVTPWALLALLALPLALRPLQAVTGGATGRDLVPALAGTGVFQLAWSVLLALGLSLGRS